VEISIINMSAKELHKHVQNLQHKIEIMEEKYGKDPSWINKTLLECMLLDYESKQSLLIRMVDG